jgi:hypothetical protein
MAGHGGTVGFAIGYVVLRSMLIALYGRAWFHVGGPAGSQRRGSLGTGGRSRGFCSLACRAPHRRRMDSLRDRTFLGRIWLAALTLTLAAAGGNIAPLGFTGLLVAALLGQLLLEAFTVRAGAATVLEPGSQSAPASALAGPRV